MLENQTVYFWIARGLNKLQIKLDNFKLNEYESTTHQYVKDTIKYFYGDL